MKALPWIFVGVLLIVALWGWLRPIGPTLELDRERDTATLFDTVPYYLPVPRDSQVVRYVVVRLPSASIDGHRAGGPSLKADTARMSLAGSDSLYQGIGQHAADSPSFSPAAGDTLLFRFAGQAAGSEISRAEAAGEERSVFARSAPAISLADSIEVAIPITQKVYGDSTFTAYVSGFQPSLDSIFLYPRTQVVTVREKPRRWSLGVGAGYGLTPRGFQPFVGVSVSYTLWNF